MGYHIHHAIIVTSWKKEHLAAAHKEALDLFDGKLVSEIIDGAVNGFKSFVIVPDGSKEGWPESDELNIQRTRFKETLRERNRFVDWLEVSFGGDEPDINTKILDSGHYTESKGGK